MCTTRLLLLRTRGVAAAVQCSLALALVPAFCMGQDPGRTATAPATAPAAFAPSPVQHTVFFASRFGDEKARALREAEAMGSHAQVLDGLEWLRRHQDDDGRWDADGFMKHDKEGVPCDGRGGAANDVGVTALALLAFLGDGHTMREGQHRAVVRKGIAWLEKQQGADGLFGTPHATSSMYGHAIATLAVCEAYGLSQHDSLKPVAQKAIGYIQNARNPFKVWRYAPRAGDNDTSNTGWMVLALDAARTFKLDVDAEAFKASLLWFDQVTDPSTGLAGYTKRGEPSSRTERMRAKFPTEKTECLTALALLGRVFLGQDPRQYPVMEAAANSILKKPPVWNEADGSIDMSYWLHGSHAMFQMGGVHWTHWKQRMLGAVTTSQRMEGNFGGSWDPKDAWGEEGGRVYSTAVMVLCLESSYRYGKVPPRR